MTNVRLSKRLNCIAKMVEFNSVIADIGCDHALLDIYLIQKNIIKKAIACDINEGALNQAKKNVFINNINNIDLRLSDGLKLLKKSDNIDTIIISGLGNQKIIKILDDKELINLDIKCIIIQSNTHVYKVREYLVKKGFYIHDEKLIKENKIIYTIIKFMKGHKKYSAKQIYYGPIILKNKNELFNELLNDMILKNKNIINSLPNKMLLKKIALKINNLKIKKEMI